MQGHLDLCQGFQKAKGLGPKRSHQLSLLAETAPRPLVDVSVKEWIWTQFDMLRADWIRWVQRMCKEPEDGLFVFLGEVCGVALGG